MHRVLKTSLHVRNFSALPTGAPEYLMHPRTLQATKEKVSLDGTNESTTHLKHA